jgi:hypothetical protein
MPTSSTPKPKPNSTQLPADYQPLKRWEFWLLGATTVLAFVDIFLQIVLQIGTFQVVLSAILFSIFVTEIYFQLKRRRTVLGLRFVVFIAAFYILSDIMIYFLI